MIDICGNEIDLKYFFGDGGTYRVSIYHNVKVRNKYVGISVELKSVFLCCLRGTDIQIHFG